MEHKHKESLGDLSVIKEFNRTKVVIKKTKREKRTAYPEWVNHPEMFQLWSMLSIARPANGKAEQDFCSDYIDPIANKIDNFGNYWSIVGNEQPTTLFSCHTDTVAKLDMHSQDVELNNGIFSLHHMEQTGCLGADDTAGIWIMINMIKAGVKGLYIFHRQEEIGGRGSSFIARECRGSLEGIKRAIAFDRKGKDSVITNQSCGRCCSDTFANALAAQLGGSFRIDTGGTFTDTANYVDIIPECTNLSIGYENCHTPSETLDAGFAAWMLDRCVNLDWDALPTHRDPLEYDQFDQDENNYYGMWKVYGKGAGTTFNNYDELFEIDHECEMERINRMSMDDIVKNYPGHVTDILIEMGIDRKYLMEYLSKYI